MSEGNRPPEPPGGPHGPSWRATGPVSGSPEAAQETRPSDRDRDFLLSAIGLCAQTGLAVRGFRKRYPDTAPPKGERPVQYSKLLLDRLDAVVAPFGLRQRVATSLFQPVEVTSMYPIAVDHFHQAVGHGKLYVWPVVAVTSVNAIPPFAPPFKYGWIEWVDKGAMTGVAVITFDEKDPEVAAIPGDEYARFAEGARWVQVLIPYFGIAHDDKAMDVDFVNLVAISPEGKLLRGIYLHHGQLLDAREDVDNRPIYPGSTVRLIDVSAPGVCTLALFFQALLSCRNVDRIPVEPPAPLSKKRVRRGGLPLVRYHRLRIRLPGKERTVVDPAKLPRVGEAVVGLHYVRGHFKSYTAERPLLGRAVGTFYWPPCLKGKASAGVVGKTYVEIPGGTP